MAALAPRPLNTNGTTGTPAYIVKTISRRLVINIRIIIPLQFCISILDRDPEPNPAPDPDPDPDTDLGREHTKSAEKVVRYAHN